jgi:hypothetical protein
MSASVLLGIGSSGAASAAEASSDPRRSGDAAASDPRRASAGASKSERKRSSRIDSRPDEKHAENPRVVDVFGRPLEFSGRFTHKAGYVHNEPQEFDDFESLDDSSTAGFGGVDLDGDSTELEESALGKVPTDSGFALRNELELRVSYSLSDDWAFFIEGRVRYQAILWAEHGLRRPVYGTPATPTTPGPGTFFVEDHNYDRWEFTRGEMYVNYDDVLGLPFGLRVGRQRFADDRQWWWNQDFDALRVYHKGEKLDALLAIAEDLFPAKIDERGRDLTRPRERDILRVFGAADWNFTEKNALGIFALYQYDHSSSLPVGNCNRDRARPGGAGQPLASPDNIRDSLQFANPPPAFEDGCISDRDADESDANLAWIGLSAENKLSLGRAGTLYFSGELAGVFGEETLFNFDSRAFIVDALGNRIDQQKGVRPYQRRVKDVFNNKVRGYGGDLRLTHEMPRLWNVRPSVTAGYAYGSGDSNSLRAETDGGFRQTRLQRNNDKYRGVDSFRYYGELLDPELSNMHIATGALGFRFWRDSSVEFVYHYYRQAQAKPYARNLAFGRDPNVDPLGRPTNDPPPDDPDLGHEWDLIVGIDAWPGWELELVGAAFMLGDAFKPKDGQLTYLGELQIRYNF